MEKINKLKKIFSETVKDLNSNGVGQEELSLMINNSLTKRELKYRAEMFAPNGVEDPSDGMIYPLVSD